MTLLDPDYVLDFQRNYWSFPFSFFPYLSFAFDKCFDQRRNGSPGNRKARILIEGGGGARGFTSWSTLKPTYLMMTRWRRFSAKWSFIAAILGITARTLRAWRAQQGNYDDDPFRFVDGLTSDIAVQEGLRQRMRKK